MQAVTDVVNLNALSLRMAIITNSPVHVNAGYLTKA